MTPRPRKFPFPDSEIICYLDHSSEDQKLSVSIQGQPYRQTSEPLSTRADSINLGNDAYSPHAPFEKQTTTITALSIHLLSYLNLVQVDLIFHPFIGNAGSAYFTSSNVGVGQHIHSEEPLRRSTAEYPLCSLSSTSPYSLGIERSFGTRMSSQGACHRLLPAVSEPRLHVIFE